MSDATNAGRDAEADLAACLVADEFLKQQGWKVFADADNFVLIGDPGNPHEHFTFDEYACHFPDLVRRDILGWEALTWYVQEHIRLKKENADLEAALAQAQHFGDQCLATVERQAARSCRAWEGVLARIAAIDARPEAEYDEDDCEKPSPAQIAAARQFVAENNTLTPPGDVYAMMDGNINMTWVLPLGARLEVDVEADGTVAGTLLWREKDEKELAERSARASGHGLGVAFLHALLKGWPPPETPPDAAPGAT